MKKIIAAGGSDAGTMFSFGINRALVCRSRRRFVC
jgi:hypothetical protein